MMTWKFILPLLIGIAYLAGCSSDAVELRQSIADIPQAKVTASTPSPTSIAPAKLPSPITSTQQIIPILKVASKPTNSNFGWVQDKPVLLYTSRDPLETWSYDVVSQKSEALIAGFPWQPAPEVLAKLPPTARAIKASPSGNKLLYTTPDARSASPVPVDGQSVYQQQFAELWLVDRERTSRIGLIEDCIGGYRWSANELMVVILPDSPPGKCETAESWVLNLKTGNLTSWLIKSDYDHSIHITDVNDDGSAVLFGTSKGTLYVRTLNDNTDTLVINRPGSGVKGAWLHDSQKILIEVTPLDSLNPQFLIYSSTAMEPQEVTIALPDLLVSEWRLSIDREWLAFRTEKRDEFQSNGLWIADLRSVQ